MSSYKIAAIPGDGIGVEVISAGVEVLQALADKAGTFSLDFKRFDWSSERYLKEGQRLYGVLDRRLANHEFVADAYSIADIAIWPWVSRFEWQTIDLNQYPNVKRWYVAIANRPAVKKGYAVPKDMGPIPMP